ncbi:hypothetical protein [Ferroacidibacillus organovorans]|uniref:Cbb3-type cytochrome c oxidase subunit I n=1 Tax=Ferroacidibacillus organovorans TaxID=1765683 RepID=A0A101XRM2_9BACL|nr:hypothetical protein [Ferroacidibacillus organovorans]KUO96266.1 hypothetical protein ATW55_03335 [Ferroacidibacillus organovorans]
MTVNQAVTQKKSISVTVYYMIASLIWSIPALLLTGVALPQALLGNFGDALLLAAIHALILGTLLTAAAGVLWQFIPIAFQAPPLSRRVLYFHLPVHTISVVLMVYGFVQNQWTLVAWGGCFLLAATIAYGAYLFTHLRRARNQTVVQRLIAVPLLTLPLVMILGLLLATHRIDGTNEWLMTHAALGFFGFWISLVMVISYKFIPMFTLSHGYRVTPRAVMRLYYTGVILLLVAELLSALLSSTPYSLALQSMGAIVSLISLALFVRDIFHILHVRKRRKIVSPLIAALLATSLLVTAALLALMTWCGWLHTSIAAIAYLMILGGLFPLQLAYMHKVIPFLRYEYRYSHAPDRKSAPLIDDMVQKTHAKIGSALYAAGFLISFSLILIKPHTFSEPVSIALSMCQAAGILFIIAGFLKTLQIGGVRPGS